MYHRRVEDPALCLRAGEPINSDDKMVIRTAEGLTEDVYIVFGEISEIEPNRPALVASTMTACHRVDMVSRLRSHTLHK